MQSVAPSSATPNPQRRPPHAAHHRRCRGPDRAVGRAQALRQARGRAAVAHRRHPHGVVLRRRGLRGLPRRLHPAARGRRLASSTPRPAATPTTRRWSRRSTRRPASSSPAAARSSWPRTSSAPPWATPSSAPTSAAPSSPAPSAGASIMSRFMISLGEEGLTPKQRASQISAGLGLVEDVIIDQHFDQRGRYGRLMSMVAASPNLLGMGIDENTAAEIRDGTVMSVIGAGVDLRHQRPQRHHRRPRRASRRAAARFGRSRALAAHGQYVRPGPRRADAVRRASPRHRGSRSSRPRSARRARRRAAPLAETRPSRRTPARTAPTAERVCRIARPARPRRRTSMAVEGPTPTGPARPDLKILETRIYRGPNVWSYQQAIHLVVDLGSLEEYPTRLAPRLHRPARRARPRARAPHLLARPTRRVHRAAARGHLARPRRRARRAPAADPGRPRLPPRQDPRGQGQARPLQRRLQLHRRDRRRRGGQARGAPHQPPRRRPRTASTSRRSSTPSSVRPSGWPSGPRPRPSSRRRPRATSPTSASTRPRSSSSARASTPSGSAPR